jgi:hypothetical protein
MSKIRWSDLEGVRVRGEETGMLAGDEPVHLPGRSGRFFMFATSRSSASR